MKKDKLRRKEIGTGREQDTLEKVVKKMVILSLGSNLSSTFGDRLDNLRFAMLMLEDYGIKIKKKSSFYETPSYPNNKNPKFINITIVI